MGVTLFAPRFFVFNMESIFLSIALVKTNLMIVLYLFTSVSQEQKVLLLVSQEHCSVSFL